MARRRVRGGLGRWGGVARSCWGVLLFWACCHEGAGPLIAAETKDAARAAAEAVTRRIDELLEASWQQRGITPAAPAGDAELLRRMYLDLTGAIPTTADAQAYLADERSDKRAELVEQLLHSPAHATHLANVWRDLMLPRKFDPAQTAGLIGVQNWLRRQFVDNRRYDRIVADLLVATGGDESGPALFYTAVGLKPEELGTTTARIFLGVRLDCAQCHNHPFDRWTQEDFWGYAAFFARLRSRSQNAANMRLVDAQAGEVTLPNTDRIVPARYPGGVPANPNDPGTRREQLAIWMVSRENPYLSRATVNLVWAQLFGRGLVEPLDDIGEHNPASHPELLQYLADAFVESGYDLRNLYRVLVNTRAYQLSSRPPGDADLPAESFAQMAVKTLTPEQLFDSLERVALRKKTAGVEPLADPRRQAFLVALQTQTRTVTDFELGVPQALTLMNGPEFNQAADAAQSGLLKALEAPYLDDAQRVELAFLTALSRPPRDDERSQFVEYVNSKPEDERTKAWGDVVWALLNSAEFSLNR